jgi:NAD(P)-dependent dehydrogenase (short-subunit alcohol dehydrogenase family)
MPTADVRLDGQVVLVTGGGRGIGHGIARAFLAAGATTVICGRNKPADLPSHSGKTADFVACDVREAAAVAAMVEEIVKRHGKLDVLVNNAGGSPSAAAATASPRFSERIIALNLLAPLHCSQAAYKVMEQQADGGSIINIASISGVRPSPQSVAYGAAKAGLLNMTTSLAQEWGPKLRVNAVIVGLIATDLAASEFYGDKEGLARIAAALPARRMGKPEDVAGACLFLASPLAAYVSGAQLEVHGGGEPPAFLDLAKK